jgi:hypothetical protein
MAQKPRSQSTLKMAQTWVMLLLVPVFAFLMWHTQSQKSGTSIIRQSYYYDTVTGKLFSMPDHTYPPIDTPDQSKLADGTPAGVKASVFSCGKCDEKEWYIGYLNKYSPEAHSLQVGIIRQAESASTMPMPLTPQASPELMEPSLQTIQTISDGHLVASFKEPDNWVKQESPQGDQIVLGAVAKCPDGKYPRQCFPDMSDTLPSRKWIDALYVVLSFTATAVIAWAWGTAIKKNESTAKSEEHASQMVDLREWINRNSALVTTVSVILLYLALIYLIQIHTH